MSAITAEECLWREEGGGAAAAGRCLAFLEKIGIEVGRLGGDESAQLLDGLAIVGGRLLIDPATPVWPSDLLHEGGHIAMAPPEERQTLGPIEPDPVDEMMAIAWSFAAATACEIPVEQLFHSGGYRSNSDGLAFSFANGHYVGAPMLGFHGMCVVTHAPDPGVAPYPAMIRWLR